MCSCVYRSVIKRERKCVCEYVCVRERAREREKERKWELSFRERLSKTNGWGF